MGYLTPGKFLVFEVFGELNGDKQVVHLDFVFIGKPGGLF
jgi:hypothetical protein